MNIWNFIIKLNCSDIIQLLIIILTAVSVILSTHMSKKAIEQNSKIYNESNRANIVPSYETVCTDDLYTFFKVKNYGTIGAKLVDLSCSLANIDNKLNSQTKELSDTYFAPGQSYLFYFDSLNVSEEEKNVDFELMYIADDGRKYTENYVVKVKIGRGAERGKKEHNPFISTLQDISEQILSNR